MEDRDFSQSVYAPWYFGLCTLMAGGIALFNWTIDPLQFYRLASLYPPVYSENQRYQKPGLAKHVAYEIVVVGDSHAENFSALSIEEKLGAPALNLAISGSTAREQNLIAAKAIGTGKVRRVIWVLGRMPFRKHPDLVINKWGEFPHHFYDEGLTSHPTYLLSLDTTQLSVDALRGVGHTDLDSLNTWHAYHEFSKQRILLDWRRRTEHFWITLANPARGYHLELEAIRDNVEENLADLARAHPEVQFTLLFPPYSILSYLIDDRMAPWMFKERLQYKKIVVDEIAPLSNVELFDFQVLPEITHRLDNYKDLEHFRLAINERILDDIAAGRHRIEKSHYADVLEQFRQQVSAYKNKVCDPKNGTLGLCPTLSREEIAAAFQRTTKDTRPPDAP